jgi:plasmid stability protein
MKTTIELPDDLMREIKIRAAREDRKLKDLVADLLRRGLEEEPRHAEEAQPQIRNRVQFPLIKGTHPAKPGTELTPDQMKQLLIDEELEAALRVARQ